MQETIPNREIKEGFNNSYESGVSESESEHSDETTQHRTDGPPLRFDPVVYPEKQTTRDQTYHFLPLIPNTNVLFTKWVQNETQLEIVLYPDDHVVSGSVVEVMRMTYHQPYALRLDSGLSVPITKIHYFNIMANKKRIFVYMNLYQPFDQMKLKELPLELVEMILRFCYGFPDLLEFRLISRYFSSRLKLFEGIKKLNLGLVPNKKMSRKIMDLSSSAVDAEEVIFPVQYKYLNEETLSTISKNVQAKKITFWFPSLSLHKAIKFGSDIWSPYIEEIELIGLYIFAKNFSSATIFNLKLRYPNLRTITLDGCRYTSRQLYGLIDRCPPGVHIVTGPHSNCLGKLTNESAKHLISRGLNPNQYFKEVSSNQATRSTNLLDLAIVRGPVTNRRDVLFINLVHRGSSINNSITRYGWWSMITSPRGKADIFSLLELAKDFQRFLIMPPEIFKALTGLEGIDTMTEETIAEIFKLIGPEFLVNARILYRGLSLSSPHFYDIVCKLVEANVKSAKDLERLNRDQKNGVFIAINNESLSDEFILNRLIFPESKLNLRYTKFKHTYLHACAFRRRYLLAEELLLKGADPNVCNELQQTPLQIAMELNDEKMCELMKSYNAKLPDIEKLISNEEKDAIRQLSVKNKISLGKRKRTDGESERNPIVKMPKRMPSPLPP